MSWRHLFIGCLFLLFFNSAKSQSYLGSWALDWSQVLDTAKYRNPLVLIGLDEIENKPGTKLIWVFDETNLRIMRDGEVLSEASIEWTENDRFVITRPKKSNDPTHIIEPTSEGKIRVLSDKNDAEIFLRKL